jgi:pyruvate kinase
MRRTKLICTIGPASTAYVAALVEAGMDIARVNFSHGTDEQRCAIVESVRAAGREAGREVEILADLSGPKLRLGDLPGGSLELREGMRFTLLPPGAASEAPDGACATTETEDADLARDLKPRDTVFLADGRVELRVLACSDVVVTEVVRGGVVRSRAGVNVPSAGLSLPAVTGKDRADLETAMRLGCEIVAQSFVRRAEDVTALRQAAGPFAPRIYAKVETRSAVEEAKGILEQADGIIVARGDLGIEMPFQEVPLIQKDLIGRARSAGIPGIVATQLLHSMCLSPRPTRAEASDVANAALDGANGVLLSDETAIGGFPVPAAQAAACILESTEAWVDFPWKVTPTGDINLRRLA